MSTSLSLRDNVACPCARLPVSIRANESGTYFSGFLCKTCFSLSAGSRPAFSMLRRDAAASLARLWALAFRGAANPGCRRAFQPASLYRDEFLGLRSTMPSKHEAGENTCQVPEWPVQCLRRPGKAACRHDCLPHRAAECMPRMAKAECERSSPISPAEESGLNFPCRAW